MNMPYEPTDTYRVTAILSMTAEDDLDRQLRTVYSQSLYAQGQLEIVLVACGTAADRMAPFQTENRHIIYLSLNRPLSKGQALALGARLAGGDYLMVAALEDSVAADALQSMTAVLDRDAHLAAVAQQNPLNQATVLFRRSVLARIWETEKTIESACPEDWLTRLAADGYRTAAVDMNRGAMAQADQRPKTEQEIKAGYHRLCLGAENMTDGQRAEALEALIGQAPQMAVAHNDLGVLYHNLGRKQEALHCYQTAVELAPDNVTFCKNLADFFYFEFGRVEDCLRIYVRLLAIDPKDAEVLLTLGRISEDVKRLDDARDFYRRVIEVAPDNAQARERLEVLTPTARPRVAVDSAREFYGRAQSLIEAGRLDEAARKLAQLVVDYPDFAPAHNDLGAISHQLGRKPEAVAGCYERAVALAPDNGVYRKNLADFYHLVQARTAEALRLYVRLLADYPQDVEVLMALGRICEDVGQNNDARFFYDCVLQFDPAHAEAYRRAGALK